MIDLNDSTTFRNLLELFSRDSQSVIRYQLFARTAEYEGLRELAALFRRLSDNHMTFSEGHLDFIRTVCDPLSRHQLGRTVANVASAIATELDEGRTIYPSFSHTADAEGFVDVASWLRTVGNSKNATVTRI